MTTIPVIGSALIRAHKLAGRESGALLILDDRYFSESLFPPELKVRNKNNFVVDWINSRISLVEEILFVAKLEERTPEQLAQSLEFYCCSIPKPPKPWNENTFSYIDTNLAL